MKKYFPLFLLFILLSRLNAQSVHRCYTHELMQHREQQTPGYMQVVDSHFNQLKEQSALRSSGDTIYRIRTVVHVVYTAADENIPDALIWDQLQVLNENFRRQTPDTVRTRDVFQPFAADAGIEFYLADTDPDGNPTTGITRTQGSPGFLGFEPFSDNVKSAATGGKNPWPTDRYLNIWVCNILNGLGILGYAFPPSDAPNWPAGSVTDSSKQGVVIHYTQIGRNNPAALLPEVAEGRTAVHEVGHYLGLRHIWGDGDCTEDDGLEDTPDAADASQQSCDTLQNTCTEAGVEYPDMIENYMDYSDERCQNMFTHQQVGIMRASLQGSRAGVADILLTGMQEENIHSNSLKMFPNPVSTQLHIQWTIASPDVQHVGIVSADGRVVTEWKGADCRRSVFSVAHLPSGLYTLQVAAAGHLIQQRFVKLSAAD